MSSSYIVLFSVQAHLRRDWHRPVPEDQKRYLETIDFGTPDFFAYCTVDFRTKKAFEEYEADEYCFSDLRPVLNRHVFGMHYWRVSKADKKKMNEVVIAEDGAFKPVSHGFIETQSMHAEPIEGAHVDLGHFLRVSGYGKYLQK